MPHDLEAIRDSYLSRVDNENAYKCGHGGGFIYVYTFESCINAKKNRADDRCQMKIGCTDKASAEQRIYEQMGAAANEKAILLISAAVDNVRQVERQIHSRLNRVESAPGKEWFWTSVPEVGQLLEEIVGPHALEEWDPAAKYREIRREQSREYWNSLWRKWVNGFAWIGVAAASYHGYQLYTWFTGS